MLKQTLTKTLTICAGAIIAISQVAFGQADWSDQFDQANSVNGSVYAIAVDDNGDVYVGGEFTTAGGVTVNNIAKWDGNSWSALGSGTSGRVNAILIYDNVGAEEHMVYVGGIFLTAGGISVYSIARWDTQTESWSAMGNGVRFNNDQLGSVYTLAMNLEYGNTWMLYVGGRFGKAGTIQSNSIARVDINSIDWSSIGGGFESEYDQCYAIAFDSYYGVIAGGDFYTDETYEIKNLARWYINSWSEMGNPSGNVYAMAYYQNDLYVGGGWSMPSVNGGSYFAKWDGSNWSKPKSGSYFQDDVYAIAASEEDDLYVGGRFYNIWPQMDIVRIARWDGSNYYGLGSGLNNNCKAIAITESGVYVGGYFTTAGENPSYYFGKWNFPVGILSVSPASIAFDDLFVGETATGQVTVANTGTANLYVSSISFSGVDVNNFSVNTTPFTLAPGNSQILDVGFTPDMVGSFSALLNIDSDVGTKSVALTGNGIGYPILSVAPLSVDFGDVVVGETTTEQVTVSNIGTADLNVSSISISGIDANNFSVNTTQFTLTPGDDTVLDVSFTLEDTGSFSALLDIDSDGGSASVTLTGIGVAPEISVTPLAVDYGDVLVGETTTEQVTVKNTGTADLNVSSITISGVDSLNFSPEVSGSFTLTPGDSSFLYVIFTPDTTIIFSGSLNIDSDGGSASISLSGNGVAPEIFVSPVSIDFGDVLMGETTTEQVTVKNTGTSDLNVSDIMFTGIDSVNFSIDTTHFFLAPGDSLYLEVSFNPNTSGNFNASMVIASDGGIVTLSLSGYSINPAPSIVSISDVPDDQGGWVYLSWESSMLDTVGDITQYGIWELNPEDEWVSLGNVPGIQEEEYIYVAHTLGDSTDEGIFWSTFMVTAHTTDPEVFYTSPVDSGYSIDNLAPAVPTGLLASITEENMVELSWDSPVDEDFEYFKIYRSLEPDFDPTGTEPFAETIDTTFIDSDVEIGDTLYYRISAVDFNGNESEYTDVVEATVILSIDDLSGIPMEFGLHQNYPNPFNPVTTLRYDLPEQVYVTLVVYDLLGREVKRLVSGIVVSGYHAVVWDGTNNAGESVGAGVYLYQIRAGDFVKTWKMVLLK